MGIRSIIVAGQQSLAKKILTNFSSDFSAADLADFAGQAVSGTTKKNIRGRTWSFLRGNWGISNDQFSATTSADYPIAIVDALVPDVAIEIKNISSGAGSSLWVTDAGNWWGVGLYQESVSCNCSTCSATSCQTCYSPSCQTCLQRVCQTCNQRVCQTCQSESCQTCYGNYCSSYGCTGTSCSSYTKICAAYGCTSYGCTSRATGIAGQPCLAFGCTGYGCASFANYCSQYTCSSFGCTGYTKVAFSCNCTTTSFECNCTTTSVECNCSNVPYECNCVDVPYDCNCSTFSYSCNCQTCYPQYIRLLQSVSNTVTTVASWALSTVARSLRIKTKNKALTVESFSDIALATKIQENEYSANTAIETTKFGLLVSPSQYAEKRSIQEINIERNP